MTEALNIAIVEDDKVHADITCRLLKEWLIEKDIKHYIKKYISAEAFLFEWEQNQLWDALFLDIQMPGINGMELAKSVREHNNDVSIVFVTGITDYLQEGYEVEALHYLIKPVNEDKIRYCMERICKKRENQEKKHMLIIEGVQAVCGKESENITLRLYREDIIFIEASGHNINLNTKEAAYCIREGISIWQKRLNDKMFVLCHRSYIVNLMYVSKLEKNAVILDDGKVIPMSKRCAKSVKEAFISFYVDFNEEV